MHEGVNAAFVQREPWVVAEIAADGVLVGHETPRTRTFRDHLTVGGRTSRSVVS
jgi:hypothetical protein